MTHPQPGTTASAPHTEQHQEWQVLGNELASTVQHLLHESNVRRIIIKHDGQTALEIPLTVGVIGTLLVPWLAAVGAMGALLAHFTIEVVRTDTPAETPGAVPPTTEGDHHGA